MDCKLFNRPLTNSCTGRCIILFNIHDFWRTVPLLFFIYINDLPGYAKHNTIRLFTDDCVLQILSDKGIYLLQENINTTMNWASTWSMRFNSSKCCGMYLTHKPRSTASIKYVNSIIQHWYSLIPVST